MKCAWRWVAVLLALPAVLQAAERPGRAAIASAHTLATDAGFEILAAGGNAFDAAVAVSAALAVVEPASSGIGGGGFWLLMSGDGAFTVMIDGRETAPAAAHRDLYLDAAGQVDRDRAINGPLAAGIPGAPAAWAHLTKQYGRLSLADNLAPAIRLAEHGFAVDRKYRQLLGFRAEVMQRWPETAAIFMPDGDVPEIGAVIRQPDLATTLRRVAASDARDFYTGETAARLVAGVAAAGGVWTLDDLAAYRIAERAPIEFQHRGYRLITAPPPSSGGLALGQILNIVEPWEVASMTAADRIHLLVEAMRRAYRDRALYLGDPDFVEIPGSMLLHPHYAAGLRAGIRMDQATPSAALSERSEQTVVVDADTDRLRQRSNHPESDNTTHFSLMDADGNLVSATLTINLPYGCAFAAPGTGVLLNNEMDDFAAAPGEPNAYGLVGFAANAIEPGKRMLSSMTPTIVLGPERTAVLGTPGGSRIITMVLLGILDFMAGHGPQSWVSLPRFHHQYLPDEILFESEALSDEIRTSLEGRGHQIVVRQTPWGNMHGVMWNRVTGEISAAADPRWESGEGRVEITGGVAEGGSSTIP